MTSLRPRFCPRCGTARVADMSFCPGCGLNLREIDEGTAAGASEDATATGAAGDATSTMPAARQQPSSIDHWDGGGPSDAASHGPGGRTMDRSSRVPIGGIVFAVILVGALVLLFRPQLPGSPGPGGPAAPGSGDLAAPGVTPVAPSAPIVGLTILSPEDGQAVASKDVTVIGLAPPGVTITQDVSFGLDQHATVDGTGHWAMKVGLNEGENKLKFRIGDDHSTEQEIRIVYTAPQQP